MPLWKKSRLVSFRCRYLRFYEILNQINWELHVFYLLCEITEVDLIRQLRFRPQALSFCFVWFVISLNVSLYLFFIWTVLLMFYNTLSSLWIRKNNYPFFNALGHLVLIYTCKCFSCKIPTNAIGFGHVLVLRHYRKVVHKIVKLLFKNRNKHVTSLLFGNIVCIL